MCLLPDIKSLKSVTREEVEMDLESVLALVDSGFSPIVITSDGKPDLLLFSWEDYKRRFSMIYPPEYFSEIEEAFCACEEGV